MSKFYVFGDVHQHWEQAQAVLNKEKPEKCIWLGDFFDDSSTTEFVDTAKTAIWLNEMLEARPQDIIIQSNHDLVYRFDNDKYRICGSTPAKERIVKTYFNPDNWKRFVLFLSLIHIS